MNKTPSATPPDPEDRLLVAISTLQAISLAQTSLANGADKWGIDYMPTSALDETIAILIGLLDHLGNSTPENPQIAVNPE